MHGLKCMCGFGVFVFGNGIFFCFLLLFFAQLFFLPFSLCICCVCVRCIVIIVCISWVNYALG